MNRNCDGVTARWKRSRHKRGLLDPVAETLATVRVADWVAQLNSS
ncbi:hypothetical protein [Nostoc sp.]